MVSVVSTWDGHKVNALRVALRMTQEALAAHLGVAPRAVAKWHAQRDLVPAMATQQLLDVALAQSPDEAKSRFGLLLAEVVDEDAPPPSTQRAPATTSVLEWARMPSKSVWRATPETITYLKKNLYSQYTTDNLLGPRALLPMVTGHVAAIDQIRQNVSGPMLDELLNVGAGYAEFAGWLCQDSGDLAGAQVWCDRALEWAQAGGDHRMQAFIVTRRAVQSLETRQAEYAARLAAAGQRGDDPETTSVRTIAALTEATAHAMAGDSGGTDRALDNASALLDSESNVTEGDPTQDRYCALDLYSEITRAKCYLELGRADAAIGSFRDVLAQLPAEYHRDRGQYLARLAQAQALDRQPEAASASAEEALSIAIATGSSRTIDDLRALPVSLAPWSNVPEVARFTGMLATVEQTNGSA